MSDKASVLWFVGIVTILLLLLDSLTGLYLLGALMGYLLGSVFAKPETNTWKPKNYEDNQ